MFCSSAPRIEKKEESKKTIVEQLKTESPEITIEPILPEGKTPKLVLCLDLDDTLIDIYKSHCSKKPIYFEAIHKIRELIALARENDIEVMCVTSRHAHENQESKSPVSVRNLLHSIDPKGFSKIIYTNAHVKGPVLSAIAKVYDLPVEHVGLADDNMANILSALSLGHIVFPVFQKQIFLEDRVIPFITQDGSFVVMIEHFIKSHITKPLTNRWDYQQICARAKKEHDEAIAREKDAMDEDMDEGDEFSIESDDDNPDGTLFQGPFKIAIRRG